MIQFKIIVIWAKLEQRMMHAGRSIAGLGLCFWLMAAPALADDLKLSGPGGQSVSLAAADIAALPHARLTVTAQGKTVNYEGVPLSLLLAKVGAPSGRALHGPALREIVVVTGRDGYRAALALAETDPGFRKDQVLLADRADGQPLPPTAGPWRLVVEGDQRPARGVRMVAAIKVEAAP